MLIFSTLGMLLSSLALVRGDEILILHEPIDYISCSSLEMQSNTLQIDESYTIMSYDLRINQNGNHQNRVHFFDIVVSRYDDGIYPYSYNYTVSWNVLPCNVDVRLNVYKNTYDTAVFYTNLDFNSDVGSYSNSLHYVGFDIIAFEICFTVTNNSALTDAGYEDGYNTGNTDGYEGGYNTGYNDGYNNALDTHDFTFSNLFASIADTPILYLRRLFGFELFGVSIMSVFMSLFTALIVIHLIKKVF